MDYVRTGRSLREQVPVHLWPVVVFSIASSDDLPWLHPKLWMKTKIEKYVNKIYNLSRLRASRINQINLSSALNSARMALTQTDGTLVRFKLRKRQQHRLIIVQCWKKLCVRRIIANYSTIVGCRLSGKSRARISVHLFEIWIVFDRVPAQGYFHKVHNSAQHPSASIESSIESNELFLEHFSVWFHWNACRSNW